MLPGEIMADGPASVPIQLMVARPKANEPHTSDQGPIRQVARPSPSWPAAAAMSASRPAQNAAERDRAPPDLVVGGR